MTFHPEYDNSPSSKAPYGLDYIPTHLFSLFVCEQVFGMAISTILQCFIADEEMFKGDDRYGEGDLAAMLDKASRTNSKGEAKVVAVENKADEGGPTGAGDHALP